MKVLSIDIGASSGRLALISYDKMNKFSFEEIYRFSNGQIVKNNSLYWDFNEIMNNILIGLNKAFNLHPDIKSIGVDTWGVDYGRLNETGELIDEPFGYRDERCFKASSELLKNIDYKTIYGKTGIQFLNFNTIFQLFDDYKNNRRTQKILLIPDLINYYLTGYKYIELTNLSTTALYNPISKKIDDYLLGLIKIDKSIFPQIIFPSSVVGELKDELVEKFNLKKVKVLSVGSHDTASAIASLHLTKNVAYLSSGTWSLLGVELDKPIINDESYKANFTNEIGLENKIRFLKNIMGLFIIQELKKEFEKEDKQITFGRMHEMSKEVSDNDIYVDINDELFQKPNDMLNKYYLYLKKTNQYKGEMSIGEITRSIYESMAFKYLDEFLLLKSITKLDIKKLIIVGGGSNAKLLNQLIANVLGIEVEIGESEGTAYGNALAQLIYWKEFSNLDEAREELYRYHFKEVYYPKEIELYQEKYKVYKRNIGD